MSVASEYLEITKVPADQLVKTHAPLVRRIAYHLMGRLPPSVDANDLMQAGMIGLLEAARNYSPTRAASFETYAGIRIRGAMLDELRKTDWTPRSVHRKLREVAEVTRQIENETGGDADDLEVMKRLGIDAMEYNQILADAASARLLSLTAPEATRVPPSMLPTRMPRARMGCSRRTACAMRWPNRSTACPSAKSW